jgi:predicted metal-dependent hydrolase
MNPAARPDVEAAVRRGARHFNRGHYLLAQQAWEAVWTEAAAEARGFLEGLIQIAGGLHLRIRGAGTRGAVHLLSQALVTLEDYRPAAYGVDVDALVSEADAFVTWLKSVDRPHRAIDRLRLPRMRPVRRQQSGLSEP